MRAYIAAVLLLALTSIARADTYRLNFGEIRDLAGAGGFKAFSVLTPPGWTSEGGVHWNQPCALYGYSIGWQSAAHDKSEGVGLLPAITWGGQSKPGCRTRTFDGLSQVLAAQVRSLDPNARFLGFRERPDLVDQQLPTLDLGTVRSSFRSEAGTLDFQMTDVYGQHVKGRILGKMVHVVTQTTGYGGVPPQVTRGGAVEPSFVYLALPQIFDLRLAEVIRKSILPDPRWASRMHRHHAQTDRIRLQGNIELMRFQARFLQRNSGLFATFSQRDPNGAWIDRERSEAIRGVETYVTSDGTELQLDHTYPYAWQLDGETFLITDDPNYDPNVGSTLQAVRLRPAP